ncbi:MAG TPA: prepilin-type N-terminal cleavage/methylation domain-containing protein [Gemmatimonadales bacterium]|nr:prepilin-type N-terminal cleavage/methylation domain-containing protein [Gemmatimonadales bacterium]
MRQGSTLVELLVALAILGLASTLTVFTVAGLRAPVESPRIQALREARARAIRTGRTVRVPATGASGEFPSTGRAVLFLPDGRALGPEVELLTGEIFDATR